MITILMVIGTMVLYVIAYNTYGKYLAKKIFALSDEIVTPAVEVNDGQDFVPTRREILFGHHYTSIAGTGPIVGPAIGIIWGWVPALLWVLLGSIFMGAVHDFGSIVVSIRNRGQSIGEVASSLISSRVRIMFLLIISLSLLIVIAIFCLVISVLFDLYPESVIPIWVQLPIAVWLGHMIYKKDKKPLLFSLISLVLLYAAIVAGAYLPLKMPSLGPVGPVVIWTVILLVYAFIASTLPVWRLLQPRDYINGHQLFVAMGLLALGVLFSHPEMVAPAFNLKPAGAPPILPFLFITIACGAVSGFHSLVGSGTTSKQLSRESHAFTIGYGGMLLEGLLAVFAIIAVGAGIGIASAKGEPSGFAAWSAHYASWSEASGLGANVGAFVNGSTKMLTSLGIPFNIGITLMGVFIASFAGTTLDTATRLQRYAVTELSGALKIKFLSGKYPATLFAVVTAGILALWDGKGNGGLLLWPLFGATNQLLACLALLVITVYLAKKGKPFIITLIPFIFMFIMTGWAMFHNLSKYYTDGIWHLLVIGCVVVLTEIWMIIEGSAFLFRKKDSR